MGGGGQSLCDIYIYIYIYTLLKIWSSIAPLGSPTFTVIPLIFLITVNVGLPRGVMEYRIFNSVYIYI